LRRFPEARNATVAKAPNQNIPSEAAQIMKRMVSMPPKPHEDMKIGKAERKADKRSRSPKTISPFRLSENVEAVLIDRPIHFRNGGKSIYELHCETLSSRRLSRLTSRGESRPRAKEGHT
jgi:hypothetical protein